MGGSLGCGDSTLKPVEFCVWANEVDAPKKKKKKEKGSWRPGKISGMVCHGKE